MRKSPIVWTPEEVETLQVLAKRHTVDDRVEWKSGVFSTPEGQALLRDGRSQKDVQNRYTWLQRTNGSKPIPPSHRARTQAQSVDLTPQPQPPRSESGRAGWGAEEIQLLHNLYRRFPKGKNIDWQRAEHEAPDVWAALIRRHRPVRIKGKWYYIMASQKHAQRKAKRAERISAVTPAQPTTEQASSETTPPPAMNYCYHCGAPIAPVMKGLEIYSKLQ